MPYAEQAAWLIVTADSGVAPVSIRRPTGGGQAVVTRVVEERLLVLTNEWADHQGQSEEALKASLSAQVQGLLRHIELLMKSTTSDAVNSRLIELSDKVNAAQVASDLRFIIDKRLAEAGIVVAFSGLKLQVVQALQRTGLHDRIGDLWARWYDDGLRAGALHLRERAH